MPKNDLKNDSSDSIFSNRVSAIIIRDGFILTTKDARLPCYYEIGGKVKMNETTEEAVIRELFEKTGTVFEISRLLLVQEQTYDLAGLRHHDIVFYYLMKDDIEIKITDEYLEGKGNEESYRWLPIIGLDGYEILPNIFKSSPEDKNSLITNVISRSYLR